MRQIGYQKLAVREVVRLLDNAWADYGQSLDEVRRGDLSEPRRQAVYLAALTGAGKTIMAGEVIKELLAGPESIVLWLSHDPSLNEQTRQKLIPLIGKDNMEVIDRLQYDQQPETGKLYFLNGQKLAERAGEGRGAMELMRRWKFLASAMRPGPTRLYIVQDEAHRAISATDRKNKTRLTELVEATHGQLANVDPAPVVLGLSATPANFQKIMQANGRVVTGHVVDTSMIQDSGLIKRDIDYRIHDKDDHAGTSSDIQLLDDAVASLKEYSDDWTAFHRQESQKADYKADPVVPLLLFQMPDKIESNRDALGDWLGRLDDSWTRHFGHPLPAGAVAHVLEDHKDIEAGGQVIAYCKPQDVQARTSIRVLLAKMAVTTGWDCPRAEVLYSLRGGENPTYIAQLLGRMIRMPLAEHTLSTGLDQLNVARAILPKFNLDKVQRIAEGVRDGELPIEPEPNMVKVGENEELRETFGDEVFRVVTGLSKETSPTLSENPVKLMNGLSVMVAADRIPGVGDNPRACGEKRLADALWVYEQSGQFDRSAYRNRLGHRYVRSTHINVVSGRAVATEAKVAELDPTTRSAKARELVDALPDGFGSVYRKRLIEEGEDRVEATERTAALALDPEAHRVVASAAREQAREWLAHVQNALEADSALPEADRLLESRRNEYLQRQREFGDPLRVTVETLGPRVVSLGLPGGSHDGRWSSTHLLVDDQGRYAIDVSRSSWEPAVLETELSRQQVVAWYRNPGTGVRFNLQVPWKKKGDNAWRSQQPDFIFVEEVADGLKAAVVDPHNPDWDGLDRLRGVVAFLDKYGEEYSRWWAVGKADRDDRGLRYLDLLDSKVRTAILAPEADVWELYRDHGRLYARD